MRAMSCFGVFLLLATTAGTIHAQAHVDISFNSAKPKEAKTAQKRLAKWLKANSKKEFDPKIKNQSLNWRIFLASQGELDLRDAVATPSIKTESKSAESLACQTLELCPTPPGSAHVNSLSEVPSAIASLIQPWILLQHRRSGRIALDLAPKDSAALLTITLDGLVQGPIQVQVSPKSASGYLVWLGYESDLGQIYDFFRETLLNPSPFSDADLAPAH